jgi:serine/threonine protein kinase
MRDVSVAPASVDAMAARLGQTSRGEYEGRTPPMPKGYELLGIIGRGGMSMVHLARHRDTGRLVALKQPAVVSRRARSRAARYFAHEALVAESLHHPRVVAVHEYFRVRREPCLMMEFIDGSPLRRLVGRLSLPQVARVVEDLLAAIEHVARAGVVHRDLKPENALVTTDGCVKVADFGLATIWGRGPSQPVTPDGTTVGTPGYMAPEQAMGRRVGSAADIYSIGVIAYELLTGSPPFTDASPQEVLRRHVYDALPDVRDGQAGIPESVAEWVELMTSKMPDARPNAADAWAALESSMLASLGPRWRDEGAIAPTQ